MIMQFFVDFENTNSKGLFGAELLKENDTVHIFWSEAAKTANVQMLKAVCESGCAIKDTKLVTQGKNALDFYIVSAVSQYIGSGGTDDVVIISKDQGFNAAVEYLAMSNKKCSVASNFAEALLSTRDADSTGSKTVNIGAYLNNFRSLQNKGVNVAKVLPAETSKTIKEINTLIGKAGTKHELYVSMTKKYGQKQGTSLYNAVKPVAVKMGVK